MLCFEKEREFQNQKKYRVTGSDSASSSNNSSSSSSITKSKRTQFGEAKTEQERRNSLGSENKKTCKKPKTTNPSSTSKPVKVRKEKLGERITALQQLVSPFGKTDTASVLHEAMGYIRFLHDQVQVLSSPYLQSLPSSTTLHSRNGEDEEEEKAGIHNLRSRGLCLVPVECTSHVANSNGADFWSPVMGSNSLDH